VFINSKCRFQFNWFVPVVIIIGIALRYLVAIRGHNFDFDSFLIVSDIVDRGYNVYANTDRYNYGPIWSFVLIMLYRLAGKDTLVFRLLLIAFLSIVDMGIFIILRQKKDLVVASLFFLNPISIIITGYHNQFDNFAILLAMSAVLLLKDDIGKSITTRKSLGLVMLGLSLMTKHLFIAFPIWLAIKQRGIFQKIIILLMPIAMFLIGFFPYWDGGRQGIIVNVLQYSSWNNEIFYKLFVPRSVQLVLSSRMVWLFLIIIFAFILQQKNAFDSLLAYTCLLVVASPAIANQYLAIVVPYIAANVNIFSVTFAIVGSWYLFIDINGLHFLYLKYILDIGQNVYFAFLISLLLMCFIWSIWKEMLISLLKRMWIGLQAQLE